MITMKHKKITLAILLFFTGFCPEKLLAQYTGKPDAVGVILSAGYKSLRINQGNFDVATVELGLHNHFNDLDFGGSFSYGKDYMSAEPFSLAGWLIYYMLTHGFMDDDDTPTNMVMAISMLSGMGFNIRAGSLNIRPYYSLLRLTKIQEEKWNLNGAVGSYLTLEFGRVMFNPFCEYTFGYKKKSRFTGYAFGVSLGVKLYN